MTTLPAISLPIESQKKISAWLIAALKSTLLFFCTLFPVTFIALLIHEGGHALANVLQGADVRILLYVHPFAFNGYVRGLQGFNTLWSHASGPVVHLVAAALISVPLWKRRSISALPFLMVLPHALFGTGYGMILQMIMKNGDFNNLIKLTGWSPVLFYVLGSVFFVLGIFLLVSLFPLFGLGTRDTKTWIAIPAAILLWSLFSMAVAYLFVPGSPMAVQFSLEKEIINSANSAPLFGIIYSVVLVGAYTSLFHAFFSKLPVWMRNEKVLLTWRDLRLPGMLAVASIIAGILIIR